MKIKLISTFLVVLFILTCLFAWKVYDYNYGERTEINLTDYRKVAELAKIGNFSYFLVCKKEGDCSSKVISESKDGRNTLAADGFRDSITIHDSGYKISPDKKRIIFLKTDNNFNFLFLYDIEKQFSVSIFDDQGLKANETLVCGINSYGMDAYSCGEWINDNEYSYGIYEKSNLTDQKFKLLRKEIYKVNN